MEKVVKCSNDKCGQYFMHTEEVTECPFCHTDYGEVVEKPASSAEASDFTKASTDKLAAKKDKKEVAKTRKESFKVWKNN